jgi:hypothetical protein
MPTTIKSEKIEGLAIVVRRGSAYVNHSWESQTATFEIDGKRFMWITDNEYAIRDCKQGATVRLRAFARANGNLFRVSVEACA